MEELVASLPAWAPDAAAFAAAFSLVAFAASILLLPVLVRRMPRDYFVRETGPSPLWRQIGQTALGLLLVHAGLVMLVLPGQGILTILVGLALVDLPFWSSSRKRALLLRVARRPRVQRAIERLRGEPIDLPD